MKCAALMTQTTLVACMYFLVPAVHSADTATLTFDPRPPEQRPRYSCLGGPEYLVMCAAKWINLVRDGTPSKSRSTYWYAAEFQGFVDGVAHTTIGHQWCPGILESNDQVYAAVAEYLISQERRLPRDKGTVELVITALSAGAPCKQHSP
jgi:hypothetical protein